MDAAQNSLASPIVLGLLGPVVLRPNISNLALDQKRLQIMKNTFHRTDALKVAKELTDYLEPHCQRLIIAGSLRRRKLVVGDIEILYIPKWEEIRDGLFETMEQNKADQAIESLLAAGILEKRPNKAGVFAWGKLNKLAIHKPTGIPVDFFATDEARWWVSKVIRTGPLETNLALTTGAQALGRKLHAYGAGFTDKDGSALMCQSEEDVFRYAGVPYAEPWNRR